MAHFCIIIIMIDTKCNTIILIFLSSPSLLNFCPVSVLKNFATVCPFLRKSVRALVRSGAAEGSSRSKVGRRKKYAEVSAAPLLFRPRRIDARSSRPSSFFLAATHHTRTRTGNSSARVTTTSSAAAREGALSSPLPRRSAGRKRCPLRWSSQKFRGR